MAIFLTLVDTKNTSSSSAYNLMTIEGQVHKIQCQNGSSKVVFRWALLAKSC